MNKLLSLSLVSLFATSAFANPFVGKYSFSYTEEGNKCAEEIVITEACDGVKVMQEINGRLYDYNANQYCGIDKGTKRNSQYNSGGHAIIPSYDFTSTTVTSNAKERKITKIETEVAVSIGIFKFTSEQSLQLDGSDGLTITSKSISSASETSSVCFYKRK